MSLQSVSVSSLVIALGAASLCAQSTAPTAAPVEKPKPYVRRISVGLTASFLPLQMMKGGSATESSAIGPTVVNSSAEPQSKWYSGGIALQVAVTRRFALATNVLVRRVGYSLVWDTITGKDNPATIPDERTFVTTAERMRAYYIDAPLLVRYHTRGGDKDKILWFYEAGGTLRHVAGGKSLVQVDDGVTANSFDSGAKPLKRNIYGATAGIGLQFVDDFGIRITPEVRYTRWFGDSFHKYAARSRRDQVEIMVTFGF